MFVGEFDGLMAAVAAYLTTCERLGRLEVADRELSDGSVSEDVELRQLRQLASKAQLRVQWLEQELKAALHSLQVAQVHREEALQLVLALQGYTSQI